MVAIKTTNNKSSIMSTTTTTKHNPIRKLLLFRPAPIPKPRIILLLFAGGVAWADPRISCGTPVPRRPAEMADTGTTSSAGAGSDREGSAALSEWEMQRMQIIRSLVFSNLEWEVKKKSEMIDGKRRRRERREQGPDWIFCVCVLVLDLRFFFVLC